MVKQSGMWLLSVESNRIVVFQNEENPYDCMVLVILVISPITPCVLIWEIGKQCRFVIV